MACGSAGGEWGDLEVINSLRTSSNGSLSGFPFLLANTHCVPSWLLFWAFVTQKETKRHQVFGNVEPLAVMPAASHPQAVAWGQGAVEGCSPQNQPNLTISNQCHVLNAKIQIH